MPDVEINSDNGKNLWSNLLQEVKEKCSKTTKIATNLLILGNEGSGKSTLLARLQKSDVRHGVGLEFDYIEIKDESIDESQKLNVWVSSGDTYHVNLLKYALHESNFGNAICMITVSLSEPWNLLDSLEEWLNILKMHIDRLKLNSKDAQFYKDTLIHQFQEYSELDFEKEKLNSGKRRDTEFNYLHPCISEDTDKVQVPLEDEIFEKNLGIPIIVVITKTDFIYILEQEYDYNDDKFDFIQMHLRKICLKYGAALCYTSLKDDRNCELLLNYVLHRCYGFPIANTVSVIEKDSIFIPMGWDNNKKINILAENLSDDIKKQTYNSLITKPSSIVRASAQNRLTEPEIAEDEQVFLIKQQSLLQRMKSSISNEGSLKQDISKMGLSGTPSSNSRTRKNFSGLSSSSGNASNSGTQQANEGVLANFFSSLLNKRGVTGSPLPNQQLTVNDSLRGDGNISETDDPQKEDTLSNSPSALSSDSIQLKSKDQDDVNEGKRNAKFDIYKHDLIVKSLDENNLSLNTEIIESESCIKDLTGLDFKLDNKLDDQLHVNYCYGNSSNLDNVGDLNTNKLLLDISNETELKHIANEYNKLSNEENTGNDDVVTEPYFESPSSEIFKSSDVISDETKNEAIELENFSVNVPSNEEIEFTNSMNVQNCDIIYTEKNEEKSIETSCAINLIETVSENMNMQISQSEVYQEYSDKIYVEPTAKEYSDEIIQNNFENDKETMSILEKTDIVCLESQDNSETVSTNYDSNKSLNIQMNVDEQECIQNVSASCDTICIEDQDKLKYLENEENISNIGLTKIEVKEFLSVETFNDNNGEPHCSDESEIIDQTNDSSTDLK